MREEKSEVAREVRVAEKGGRDDATSASRQVRERERERESSMSPWR